MFRPFGLFGVVAVVGLLAGPALANTEIITAYDARSAGMGHTGTATIDNAAATFYNPANLTNIKNLDLTVQFSPHFTSATTPINPGAAYASTTSKMVLTPLAFVGLGYKLHPGVAVGLAAQLTQVKGVLYQHTTLSVADPINAALRPLIGETAAAQLFWEVRAPVAVDVTPWLTVSAGYRMGFFHQQSQLTLDQPAKVSLTKQHLDGHNFAGAQAGITVKPASNVRLGLSYRSKMVLFGTGPRSVTDLQTGTSQTTQLRGVRYASPHAFTFGASVKLLDSRLLLAGDLRYLLYKDAYAGTEHHYRDAISGHVGAEFWLRPWVPLRAGYLVGVSATRKDFATSLETTPGLQNGGTLGAGYHFTAVDLDAAIGYGASATNVAQTISGVPGRYKLNAVLASVSATVHL